MPQITVSEVKKDELLGLLQKAGEKAYYALCAFNLDAALVYKVSEDEIPIGVLFLQKYADRCYNCAFVLQPSFKNVHAKELKKRFLRILFSLSYDRIQTVSLKSEKLDRWHKFMGFSKEGEMPKFLAGKTYGIWGIVCGS